MKFILLALLVLASQFTYANEPISCQTKLKQAISQTAKIMGLNEDFSFEMTAATKAKDLLGKPLQQFSTSAFFTDDGYLSGSGALATIRQKGTSCELLSLKVVIGR